ncbi:hypothetical protein BleG1_2869 [Shouchella lehensis G1]|uniref:Uncharacterized protein n=1 Tax=Shouchella lehensis G1 TaxID=1246626 RepID=A0A060M4G1_9BACI|nr:hypothetical protein BleG1_2869 [Shouchella lehensis G1]
MKEENVFKGMLSALPLAIGGWVVIFGVALNTFI